MKAVRWAADAAELERVIGPASRIQQTLTQTTTKPLRPPYGAVRVTGALFHTQGGLMVSARAGVLRDGAEIPGLFAAGGAAAGMSGHGAAGISPGMDCCPRWDLVT